MNTIDIIVIAVLIAILGGAAFYIYRAKKKGAKCVGCPQSHKCSGGCGGCGGLCEKQQRP